MPRLCRRAGRGGLIVAVGMLLASCGHRTPTQPKPPPPPPPPEPAVVTFTPATEIPGTNVIDLSLESSSATEFTLQIDAGRVTDLFGYGLDLLYDTDLVTFDSFEAGTFLDGDGITVTVQLSEPDAGRIIVGQSRVGAVPGADGSGTLLILHFKAVAPGTFDLTIENAGAFDSSGATLQIDFLAGTITVPEDAE